MLIIFAINFNKKRTSYSQLKSISKKVNQMQGLRQNYAKWEKFGFILELHIKKILG